MPGPVTAKFGSGYSGFGRNSFGPSPKTQVFEELKASQPQLIKTIELFEAVERKQRKCSKERKLIQVL